ncbi:MAG: ABC transporter permease [Anaerolineales bacterium]
MSTRRVAALVRRILRQVLRDRRTVGLLIMVPILVLTLGAILFRAKSSPVPLGVANLDEGFTTPMAAQPIAIGERIGRELAADAAFDIREVSMDEADALLRSGEVQGVLVLAADLSAQFARTRQVALDLRLEGSNPARSAAITARVTQAAIRALAGMAAPGATGGALPVTVNATYLYAGPQFDTLDFAAPVFLALLVIFFVFLLTCVSFLRERAQATLERLLATPVRRAEIVLGYMGGLGIFALVQVTIMLTFTIVVLKIHYLGSLALLFLVAAVLAMVAVSLGILASAFARNEFQAVQFIPLLIIPQILLSGTIWAVEDMPAYLQPLAYLMPLTYANRALRDVMLKGWGLGDIWPNLVILAAFAIVLTLLGVRTMRREVA